MDMFKEITHHFLHDHPLGEELEAFPMLKYAAKTMSIRRSPMTAKDVQSQTYVLTVKIGESKNEAQVV